MSGHFITAQIKIRVQNQTYQTSIISHQTSYHKWRQFNIKGVPIVTLIMTCRSTIYFLECFYLVFFFHSSIPLFPFFSSCFHLSTNDTMSKPQTEDLVFSTLQSEHSLKIRINRVEGKNGFTLFSNSLSPIYQNKHRLNCVSGTK